MNTAENKYWSEHKRDYELRLPMSGILSRTELLCRDIASKTVLQIGCAGWPDTEARLKSGSLLHPILLEHAASITGIDVNSEGIALMKKHGVDTVFEGDIYNLDSDEKLLNVTFDIIIISEVLEHLTNPGMALQAIRDFAEKTNPNMNVIITVPNRHNFGHNVLQAIKCNEIVNWDHKYYFSYRTLRSLLDCYDYKVNEFYYIIFGAYPRNLVKRIILRILSSFSPCVTPHMYFKCSL